MKVLLLVAATLVAVLATTGGASAVSSGTSPYLTVQACIFALSEQGQVVDGDVSPAATCPIPNVGFSVSPATVNQGQSSTAQLTSDTAWTCIGSGHPSWSGDVGTNVTRAVGPFQATTTLSVDCFNDNPTHTVRSATVTVRPPSPPPPPPSPPPPSPPPPSPPPPVPPPDEVRLQCAVKAGNTFVVANRLQGSMFHICRSPQPHMVTTGCIMKLGGFGAGSLPVLVKCVAQECFFCQTMTTTILHPCDLVGQPRFFWVEGWGRVTLTNGQTFTSPVSKGRPDIWICN